MKSRKMNSTETDRNKAIGDFSVESATLDDKELPLAMI